MIQRGFRRDFLPIAMIDIIGKIRDQSLINVKHPNIFAIITKIDTFSKSRSLIGDPVQIHCISPTHDVVLDIIRTFFWDRLPWIQVISFHSKSPASALQLKQLLITFNSITPIWVFQNQGPRKNMGIE